MLQTWHTLRQIDDDPTAKNRAAGARPTGLEENAQALSAQQAKWYDAAQGTGWNCG